MAAKIPQAGVYASENEHRLVNKNDAPKLTLTGPPVANAITKSDEELLVLLSQDMDSSSQFGWWNKGENSVTGRVGETSVTGRVSELTDKLSGDFSRVPKGEACEGGEKSTSYNEVTEDEALVNEDVQLDASSKGRTVAHTPYSNNPQKNEPSVTKLIAEPKEEFPIDIIPDTTTYVPDSGTPTSNCLQQKPSSQVSLHRQGKDRRVPRFGEWDQKFSTEADDYTLAFSKAKEERKTLRNNGRVPLNWDFGADRARPLPFVDEDAFGGGYKTRNFQRGAEDNVQLSNSSQHSGVSTPEVYFPVHPQERTPKQKISHRENVTAKKGGCFRWF